MGEQIFVPGVVFTNVLLADEINRTPPRTQAALLEAMQERTVTVEGRTHQLPDPFLVIATQNPSSTRGSIRCPSPSSTASSSRSTSTTCDASSEVEMLKLPHTGVTPDMLGEIQSLLGVVGLDHAREDLDTTDVPEEVAHYIVAVVRRTGRIDRLELGASSRAAIHLLSAAKATARLDGRDHVTIDDVYGVAPYVLRHRIIARAGASADDALRDALRK